MPKLLISAAIIALLATPALAQPDHHGGPPGAPPHAGAGPHAAPNAGPRPTPGRGGPGHGPAMQARPHAAPATARPQALARPQANRGSPQGRHDNSHANNAPANRPGFANPGANPGARPGAGPANRPGFANAGANRGNNNHGANRGNRGRDYSSFRGYHQNLRSSRRFHGPSYRRPSGWYSRRWTFGEILPALFWSQQYWLNDYGSYDLAPPPYGAVWVRDGNDALLIDRDSGEIISVEYDVFY